jgi:two-component system chemotaxis sensor kinase CheA
MAKLSDLGHAVEELALQLVVAEPDGGAAADWLPSLETIREKALRENAAKVAEVAGSMISSLQAGENVAAQLAQDIVRLQEAVAQDSEHRVAPAASAPLAQDPELVADFIVESREHLAAIETQLLEVERNSSDTEALNAVFRGFHTIKGLAGFLELWAMQKLAHEVETVLDLARNSQLKITRAAIDVMLEGADHLRRWLTYLEAHLHNQPSQPPAEDTALLARIRALVSGENASGDAASGEMAAMAAAVEAATTASANQETAQAPDKPEAETAIGSQAGNANRRNEAMVVKVDTAKLDYLVDMAGEMVIAESLVRHDPELAALKSPKLQRKIGQLTRITGELQRTAMAMRLVPIGPLFRRMARLVRDLSRQFGKPVTMETIGDDIELDRTIVEGLADPLMHMVRNALDHGIEAPEERQRSGKCSPARLLLKAQHQAGQVVIEITDDGRGLDAQKIKAKALEKGLISSAEGLSDEEIHNFIFLPGFSTAANVTNVSGRGVGMDVVRKHIEKLRGRIEIRSAQGCGSTFLLKLPLTLAIIDGLVVAVGQERYIVPLFSVREMFRPTSDHVWTVRQKAEMALVRGTLLPVVRLYRRFRVQPRSEDPLESVLIVAEVEGRKFCVLVDELIGKQEVVIKPLGETFGHVAGIAGGAILGDGRVGLILDLERLFQGNEQ